jgi:hypothetical protein
MCKTYISAKGLISVFLVGIIMSFWAFSANGRSIEIHSSHSSYVQTQAVAADLLVGSDNIKGVRVAFRPYIYTLNDLPYFDDLDIYWEVSANFWEYGEHNHHTTNFVFALSPVVGKTFYYIDGKYPLKWEFGIGVSLVDNTHFAGKDIGSHYQFEDRLGLTTNVGENLNQAISVRYMHYSNGGLNSKNPGVDFLNLSYAYYF